MCRKANNKKGKQIDFSYKHNQLAAKHIIRGNKYNSWKNQKEYEYENENRANSFSFPPTAQDADALTTTPVKIQLQAKLFKFWDKSLTLSKQSFRTFGAETATIEKP